MKRQSAMSAKFVEARENPSAGTSKIVGNASSLGIITQIVIGSSSVTNYRLILIL